jgi:hypothetical protein
VEIVRAVEAGQREVLADTLARSHGRPREAMPAWWRHISDRSLWPNERLFFELHGQALHARPHAAALLDGVVDAWVGPAAEILVAGGVPAGAARAHARLGVAVARGLLLDLLATGTWRVSTPPWTPSSTCGCAGSSAFSSRVSKRARRQRARRCQRR